MLSSTDPIPTSSLCSPTEEIIFEDSFANGNNRQCSTMSARNLCNFPSFFLEIYMKFIDESPDDDQHIDLFTEIDRNHEKIMLADGKRYLFF